MLLNVRLGPEEERVVKGLRRAKVNVSALVRKAIRDAEPQARAAASPSAVLAGILRDIGPPTEKLEKRPRMDDRLAMSRYIRNRIAKRLGRK
jgi:hypothetical protein